MWVRVRGDLQAFRQMVLYQVSSKPGLSNLFSPVCHQQGPEPGKDDKSTWCAREAEAEDHGGSQPLRASWWQQSFSCFLCPHPDSGHQGWDWRVPEGTKLHSGCFILSYPTANRVCVFLPWVWFYNLESEQHTFQPPNFDPGKTAAKFRQTTTFPPEF